MGHSGYAYEAAKERLERKFGGQRRQNAIRLEDLENFKPLRTDNSKDLEDFADLLDIAVVNLKEAGRSSELGDGSLYLKLQKKMTESMLTRYHAGSTRILRSNPWKPCESGSCKNHSVI